MSHNKSLRNTGRLALLATTASLFLGHGATAQTGDVGAKGIEIVTVTAEKRVTPLQKTPVAVTALTAETIEKNRINTFADLSLRVPNMTFTQFSPQESYLSIRGTLINNNAAGWDDAVTTFIDGVPTTGLGDQNPDLFDLSEIEVLRGPQGTLFGRNVTGGAVVIHTLPPSFDPGGKAEISYGNYNAVQARGYVTGPITDTLAVKLSADVNHRDAFIKNITLGGKTDGTDEFDVRGQLLWQPMSDLEILIGADYMDDNSGGYPSRLFANFTPALFPTLSYDANTTNQGFNGVQHRQVGGGLGRVTWNNSWGVLTSITGYRNVNDHFPNNVLGDPANQLLQNNIVQDKQVTEEVDFASPTDQQLTWVAGAFYLHSNKRQGGPLVFAFDPATVAGIFSSNNNYTQTAIQRIDTDSYAIFGEAKFAASDTVNLTFGARETWERKGGTSSVSYSVVSPGLFPATANYSHSWNAFTPKVNLSWQAMDELMLYASVSRGFKSGGYDLSGTGASSVTNVALALATPFQPESEMSYEIGEKYSGLDDRLVINGDVFLADFKHLQTSQLVLLPNNQLANITSNAPGTTTSQGVELESTGIATDWLTLGLTYAYLDSHFANGGGRVPYTPRHQIHFSGDIHFPLPDWGGEVSLAGDYTYHTKVLFNPGETLPAYVGNRSAWNGIVNVHADYTTDDQQWRVSLWAKNLTDERSFLRASNVGVLFQTLPEFLNPNESLFLVKYFPERTFGLSLTHNF